MFKIEVVTRNLSDLDSPPAVKIIDYNSKEDRIWLGKHSFWALRNNHSVLTVPWKDKNHG